MPHGSGSDPAQSPVESAAAAAAAAMWAAADSLQARLELVLDERLGALTADQRGFLQVARADGKRLLKLIADFREIALADAGQLELEWSRVDLAATATDAVGAVAVRAESLEKEIVLHAEGSAVVAGDAARIADALRRLLRHALQHSAPGSAIELDVVEGGIRVRYEADSAPAPDALAVAFAAAIARVHGGGLAVTFEAGAVAIHAALCSSAPIVKIGVAA